MLRVPLVLVIGLHGSLNNDYQDSRARQIQPFDTFLGLVLTLNHHWAAILLTVGMVSIIVRDPPLRSGASLCVPLD